MRDRLKLCGLRGLRGNKSHNIITFLPGVNVVRDRSLNVVKGRRVCVERDFPMYIIVCMKNTGQT